MSQKSYFRVRTSFGEFFSIVALHDVNEGGTPYMGISPGRMRPGRHRPEREQKWAHQRTSSGSAAWDSLGKNVSKEMCFGCEDKITLFSFPKNPALCKQWMQFVFSGQQRSVSRVFVDEGFINKAQFDAGFAHRLILKDGAVTVIKDFSHDSELQTVIETASNVWFVGDRRKCSSLFSSPTTHLLEFCPL